MKKKAYMAPVSLTIVVNTERMIAESLHVDGSKTVTDDNQVFSRQGGVDGDGENGPARRHRSVWDEEEEW